LIVFARYNGENAGIARENCNLQCSEAALKHSDLLKTPLNQSRKERWQPTAGQAFAACPDVSKLVFTGQD